MTRNALIYGLLILLMGGGFVGCFGCFGSDDEPSQTEVAEQEGEGTEEDVEGTIADAMQQAQQAMQEALGEEGAAVKEAVDFRKLRDLLPEKVAGMARVNAEGERTGAMGVNISRAEGDYEDGDERMTVEILDLGTLTGFARMGFAAWLSAEVDRESDRGFERTGKFRAGGKEYPSFEQFESMDGERGSCEFQVWVAERFIVKIDGDNVEVERCEDARDEMDYRKIDRLKEEGTAEG